MTKRRPRSISTVIASAIQMPDEKTATAGVNVYKCSFCDASVFVPLTMAQMASLKTEGPRQVIASCLIGHKNNITISPSFYARATQLELK